MPKPYTPNDKLMYRAQREGFRARSVYKLQELDERFMLFYPGMQVLDIGAAPGSWLQYASESVKEEGLVIGIDLQKIAPVSDNVTTYISDINDVQNIKKILQDNDLKYVDLIISDIAPNTSGIPGVDNARSVELCQQVLEIARLYLKNDGNMIMKVFQGQEFERFYLSLRNYFRKVTTTKVKASRDRSKEIYIVCIKKRQTPLSPR